MAGGGDGNVGCEAREGVVEGIFHSCHNFVLTLCVCVRVCVCVCVCVVPILVSLPKLNPCN